MHGRRYLCFVVAMTHHDFDQKLISNSSLCSLLVSYILIDPEWDWSENDHPATEDAIPTSTAPVGEVLSLSDSLNSLPSCERYHQNGQDGRMVKILRRETRVGSAARRTALGWSSETQASQ